jgi:hypothetical protein
MPHPVSPGFERIAMTISRDLWLRKDFATRAARDSVGWAWLPCRSVEKRDVES